MAKKKVKKVKDFTTKIKFLEDLGKKYSKDLVNNRTVWEKIMYIFLKDLHYKFKFQEPVVVNKDKDPKLYILDFVLTDYNLIIEIDGKSTHTSKEQIKADNYRSKLLKQEGYYILRLFNRQVSTYTKDQVDQIIKTRLASLYVKEG